MKTKVFGIETEYAVAGVNPDDPKHPRVLCGELMSKARSTLKYLPSSDSGIFLENGARFYVDNGNHLEYATPECTTPDELVNHVRAGDQLLQNLVDSCPDVVLLRSNVDYLSKTTWGSHESYSHRCEQMDLHVDQLIPHLISRVIYCGAGGLNPYNPGVEFVLSPRALFFTVKRSQSVLSIYSTRDQSLSTTGDRRLHVIPGESLCSDIALWLRIAATCLVVTLAEHKYLPENDDILLADPVEAYHAIVCDPTLRTLVKTLSGKQISALDIQRYYLNQVQKNLDNSVLPDWAQSACGLWESMLDRLSLGSRGVITVCDWAIKYSVYQDHIQSAGFNLEDLVFRADTERASDFVPDTVSTVVELLDQSDTLTVTEILEMLRHRDPSQEPLHQHTCNDPLSEQHIPKIRKELCAIDTRYSKAGDGLFSSIESALNHSIRAVTPQTIQDAMKSPPSTTRAQLRGGIITKHIGQQDKFLADWCSITDKTKYREYVFGSPLSMTGVWVDKIDLPSLQRSISVEYNKGEYAKATGLLDRGIPYAVKTDNQEYLGILLRYRSWIYARRGYSHDAHAVARQAGTYSAPEESILTFLAIHRFQGLTPVGDGMKRWAKRYDELNTEALPDYSLVPYMGYKAHGLMKAGRLDEAEKVLRKSLTYRLEPPNHQRLTALNQCDLANIMRIRGDIEEARVLYDKARCIFMKYNYLWEYVDALVPGLIKLNQPVSNTSVWIWNAKHTAHRLGNNIALVRILLLEARIAEDNRNHNKRRALIERIQRRIPDLRACPLLTRILENWDDWINDRPSSGEIEHFWII